MNSAPEVLAMRPLLSALVALFAPRHQPSAEVRDAADGLRSVTSEVRQLAAEIRRERERER